MKTPVKLATVLILFVSGFVAGPKTTLSTNTTPAVVKTNHHPVKCRVYNGSGKCTPPHGTAAL